MKICSIAIGGGDRCFDRDATHLGRRTLVGRPVGSEPGDQLGVEVGVGAGAQHAAVGVGEQRDVETLLLAERGQLVGVVGRDGEHGVSRRVERLALGGEVARLAGAPRCHRGGIEVDDDLPAAQVGERDLLAVVVEEREVGRLITWLQSRGHGPILAYRYGGHDR